MTTVRTNAAASMLGVSPNTLRSWERRFGYPAPRRTAGGHRQFDVRELEALREAFEQTHNVSSAVRLARERGPGPASPRRLRSALMRYDEDEADRVLEESLMVRSVERTVEEVLLPGVELIATPVGDPPSPEHGFAWGWASGWMATARRAAPQVAREEGVLVLDASRRPDVDGLHAQALELLLRRAGVRALCLAFDFEPGPTRPGAGDADAAGRPAHRPPRVARRARPARLRRQAIGDRRGRLRLPRRAAGERSLDRAPPRAPGLRCARHDHRAPRRARGEPRSAPFVRLKTYAPERDGPRAG